MVIPSVSSPCVVMIDLKNLSFTHKDIKASDFWLSVFLLVQNLHFTYFQQLSSLAFSQLKMSPIFRTHLSLSCFSFSLANTFLKKPSFFPFTNLIHYWAVFQILFKSLIKPICFFQYLYFAFL